MRKEREKGEKGEKRGTASIKRRNGKIRKGGRGRQRGVVEAMDPQLFPLRELPRTRKEVRRKRKGIRKKGEKKKRGVGGEKKDSASRLLGL